MPLSDQQTADIQKQYDPMRRRLQEQENANLQTQKDALARRAASLGGGPSGAFIKQESLAQDASAKRLQAGNENVDAQYQGALNQARETQAGREFQTSERLGTQQFASGESAIGRKFQTGERLGSQDFANQQRMSSQKYATGERLGTQGFQSTEAQKGRDLQSSQFNQQMNRDLDRFTHEQEVDKFNMDMANKMYGKKDLLEQLFSNFSVGNLSNLGGGGLGSMFNLGGVGGISGASGGFISSIGGGGGHGGFFG